MASWRGYNYVEEVRTSPHESWATDASRTTRSLLFFGADNNTGPTYLERESIAQYWLGYATVLTGTGGRRYVSRFTPHYLPSGTGSPYLFATSLMSGELIGRPFNPTVHANTAPGDKQARSRCWRATFQYSVLPYDIREDSAVLATSGSPLYVSASDRYADEGDALKTGWSGTRYISKHIEQGGRVIPIRTGAFKYDAVFNAGGDHVPTMEPIPYNEAVNYVTYTWYGVPLAGYPAQAIAVQLNTVNNATFDGFAKGTLLVLGVKVVPHRDPFGNRTLDIQYRMMHCSRYNSTSATPFGHNSILHIPAPGGGAPAWEKVSVTGDGDDTKRPYRYTDFGNLFRPDQP